MLIILDNINTLKWYVDDQWIRLPMNLSIDQDLIEIRKTLEYSLKGMCVVTKNFSNGPNCWVLYFELEEDLESFNMMKKLKNWKERGW